MTKIIAIINHKGGTGKTTTTVNLGAALTKLGKSVLLIDLDSQASLSYSFGLNEPLYSMVDVFEGNRHIKDILYEKENMHIAPNTPALADVEISLVDMPGRENYLANAIKDIDDYDYIFLDCPPSLSLMTLNALKASDGVLIPLQMEVLSLRGLHQLLNNLEEFNEVFDKNVKVVGILGVRFSKRANLSREVLNYIKENFPYRVFKTVIRENIRVAEAPSFAKSVIRYSPKANGAKDYMALAKEFLSYKDNL